MPLPAVHTGLLRSSTDGLVDAQVDGARLRLLPHGGWLDLLDRYKFLFLAAAVLSLVLAGLTEPPLRTVFLVVAGVVFLTLVVLAVTEAVLTVVGVGVALTSLLTPAGRRRLREVLRPPPDPSRVHREVALADVRSVDPVRGVLRPSLVLHTTHGELRLTTWVWRRFQLRQLERALRR